jgi:hypothetical protein
MFQAIVSCNMEEIDLKGELLFLCAIFFVGVRVREENLS